MSEPVASKPAARVDAPVAVAAKAKGAPTIAELASKLVASKDAAKPVEVHAAIKAAPVKLAATPPSAASAAPAKPGFRLPDSVYSPELLASVNYDIDQYMQWYRQARVQQKVGAPQSEEPTYSAETVQVIKAWLGDSKPTVELLEALVKHLHKLKLPVVHITLAALPNHAQRSQLVDWFRANATHDMLMSFVADRNIGGGVLVRTPNRVFDYTWKQRLVEGRSKLAELVKSV